MAAAVSSTGLSKQKGRREAGLFVTTVVKVTTEVVNRYQ